jgi:hypothetical protein
VWLGKKVVNIAWLSPFLIPGGARGLVVWLPILRLKARKSLKKFEWVSRSKRKSSFLAILFRQ